VAQIVLVRQRDQLAVADDGGEPAEGEGEDARRDGLCAESGPRHVNGAQRDGDDADGLNGAVGGGLIVLEVVRAGRVSTIHGRRSFHYPMRTGRRRARNHAK